MRLVQRRERHELLELRYDRGVEAHGRSVVGAAVDDAVTDGAISCRSRDPLRGLLALHLGDEGRLDQTDLRRMDRATPSGTARTGAN